MRSLLPLRGLLVALLAIMATSCFGGDLLLLGGTDKPSVSYLPGEKMTFEVRLVRDGEQVEGTRLSWVRSGDDGRREKGEAVSSAKPLVIGTSLDKPGFVRVLVTALDEKGEPLVTEVDDRTPIQLENTDHQRIDKGSRHVSTPRGGQ